MNNITVIDSTIVRPAKDTPKHTLWLSSSDLLVIRRHVLTVYIYRPNGAPDFFDPQVLERSLADVLVPFYPVAGRLARDQNGRIELECNGEGALLVQAKADFEIDDYGDITPGPRLRSLIPTVVADQKDISSFPLLLVQVTFFKCGGVCLGVGLYHTIADGIAFSNFLKTWAATARGIPITTPPFVDRTLLRPRNPLVLPKYRHTEFEPTPQMKERSYPSSPPTMAKFKLTLDQLNTLKSSHINDKTKPKNTTYETVTAHVWRCVCRAGGFRADQPVKLHITVDGRQRLDPPLPPEFLGNAVFWRTVDATVDEIVSNPLSNTMDLIHKAVLKMNDDYLRSALDYLEQQPDLSPLVRGPGAFSCVNLSIVSWTNVLLSNTDFGWGPPIFVGPASFIEGKVYLTRSATGDGSLDVFICLECNHMDLFRKVFYNF